MEQYEFSPAEPDQIFVERDTILAELLRLSADERPYGVVVVSGPNGIGKTRLAIEWLAALKQTRRRLLRSGGSQWQRLCHPAQWRDRPWDAGFLDAKAIADLRRKDLSNWQPLQPTAVALDATNLPLEEWRTIETDLRRGAEEYRFPVRVLLLSYDVHHFASKLNSRNPGEETSIELPPLGAESARALYARGVRGRSLTASEAATLMAATGGIPILVRMMAGEPGWFAAYGAMDVLNRYAGRIAAACGTINFGTEPNSGPCSLIMALAIATLARQMDVAPFVGFSRAALPADPSIRMSGDSLLGVEPPLLGLAFLFHVDRDANASTRGVIARRAWREAPDGVASVLRHFWLSVARVERFAAQGGQPGFNDPAWIRTYDCLPAEADSLAMVAWLSTRLDLLRSPRLATVDRDVIKHDIEGVLADVQDGRAPAEVEGLVAEFWRDRVHDGDLAAWSLLDALHQCASLSQEAVHTAWLGATPAAVFFLTPERESQAFALLDRVTSEGAERDTLDAWLAAAATAVAVSAPGGPSAPERINRGQNVFRRMPRRMLERPEIASASASVEVNAIARYGAAQRWREVAEARQVLAGVAERFPDHGEIQLELAKGGAFAIGFANPQARRHGREQIATAARRRPTDGPIQALAQEHGLSFAEQLSRLNIPGTVHVPRPRTRR